MTARGPLPIPDIAFEQGAPVSRAFGDIYYNPEDGLAETRHVFLGGTGLPGRWRNKRHATVGELGFGTGLNFLATWALWEGEKPRGGHLHYVAVEAFPLTSDQISSVHEVFPSLASQSARLRAAYPPRARGHHLIELAPDVTLHLLFGEAQEMLAGLEARIETWFLDGFAPSKNPDMWSPEVMAHLARCAAPHARLATFTVAGSVRRALSDAGFSVRKAPGFGGKREMLEARFEASPGADARPWYAMPRPHAPGRIAVVGAGIAGVSCAAALGRLGCDVTLIDRGVGVGGGASGAPSGLVMPRLAAAPDAPAKFYASAHHFAVRAYRDRDAFSAGGALHLAPRVGQTGRLEKTASTGLFDPERLALLSPTEASARAGTTLAGPALFFEDGGYVDASAYLKAATAKFDFLGGAQIERLSFKDGRWQLLDGDGTRLIEVETVVLACGMGAGTLWERGAWPLEARHGQITKASGGDLALPIAYGGYAAPAGDGLWIGATHKAVEPDVVPMIDPQVDEENLVTLKAVMPELGGALTVTDHWAGIRTTTPDRLPIAGPASCADETRTTYAPLAKGERRNLPDAPYQPGLFVLSGLGARGFVSGPLLGAFIASQILGTPSPVDREVRETLHPARFTVRRLKRGAKRG